ncbi:SDR family oxidoreductase [Aspergillus stella-maris]|uniref:SDR family oxidoreductase n=1 Tax=Aspergillus stella-maris TaxID=1810926 RepID=UPI003CCE3665
MPLIMENSYTLVTGATGLIGAHVVDNLLEKGHKVRIVARSPEKAAAFLKARAEYKDKLDVFFIQDLTDDGAFDGAVKDVTGVIHIASPLNYTVTNNEQALIIPAIQGVRSILRASKNTAIKRIVLTSSFGAVLDMSRPEEEAYTYSSTDWNPITYTEAASPSATAQDAYRGSKTFAEQEAWKFMEQEKPSFDLVTLCPSMVFGPLARDPTSVSELNESNKNLWKIMSGSADDALPPCRFNFWIDVRDLAEVHVSALFSEKVGGKRYLPISREPFTYQGASEVIQMQYPDLEGKIPNSQQAVKTHVGVDFDDMERDFPGVVAKYTSFEKTVKDLAGQLKGFL